MKNTHHNLLAPYLEQARSSRCSPCKASLGPEVRGSRLLSSCGRLGNSDQAHAAVAVLTYRSPLETGARRDPPPLKWSDLRYVFDMKEDCDGKEAIQA
jgi:hypothetical protein